MNDYANGALTLLRGALGKPVDNKVENAKTGTATHSLCDFLKIRNIKLVLRIMKENSHIFSSVFC
ncbi:hypothetical protein N0B30_22720 (plasmid) [Bacillus subtilis]|uniref:hypothetical protein n=1 Tax=Bacillus subtilis group TaxID=653685 RepID=UPI00131A26B9|nr:MULTISPECIES: hypothetical protein [Bacillus subtilis group]MCT6515446.1 hypothetical protein [Bacillus subtilis]MEC0397462.1 hypothetical protein [Bacillus subtilis]MEC0407569.1 hypothetical protein [Bacillus subtilis]MEC0419552.1 hypothetical protein [Bacillus subtilis]MEC0435896.1 hypothetical protein [Bacillus subtilis]